MRDRRPARATSDLLTEVEQREIARLCQEFGITQKMVAARTRGRNRNRHRVDRSLVSKVWGGKAASRHVLRETYKALVAKGWRPTLRPSWLPESVRGEIARGVAATAAVVAWAAVFTLFAI